MRLPYRSIDASVTVAGLSDGLHPEGLAVRLPLEAQRGSADVASTQGQCLLLHVCLHPATSCLVRRGRHGVLLSWLHYKTINNVMREHGNRFTTGW